MAGRFVDNLIAAYKDRREAEYGRRGIAARSSVMEGDYFIHDLIDQQVIGLDMLNNILGPVAVVKVRSRQIRVFWCNHQFSDMIGSMIGNIDMYSEHKIDDLGERVLSEDYEGFMNMFDMAEKMTPRGFIHRGRYSCVDGRVIACKANCFYLRFDGFYKYFYISFTDITEQHFQKLRLQAAMSQNGVNCWDWNVRTNEFTVFSNINNHIKHPGIDFLDNPETVYENFPTGFVEKYEFPADYKTAFLRFTEKMYHGVDLSGRILEFPLMQSDGKMVWLAITSQFLRDEKGHVGHIVGSFTDITEKVGQRIHDKYKQHMRDALLKQAMYDITVNLTEDFIVDDNTMDQWRKETGIDYESFTDMAQQAADKLIEPEFREEYRRFFNRERIMEDVANGKGDKMQILEFKRIFNGKSVWLRMTITPFSMDPDDDLWAYVLVYNIDDMKKREEELQRLAATDSMTGLYNRAYAMQQMETQLKQHPDQNAAIIFVDLDNFKQVNDTMGHAVGDDILICTAAVFREKLGEKSILGRIGGDEFLLMCYDFNKDEIQGILEDMLQYIVDVCHMLCPDIPVTASIGYIVYPDDGKNIYSLVDKADRALYNVKEHGKNSVLRYDESMAAEDE